MIGEEDKADMQKLNTYWVFFSNHFHGNFFPDVSQTICYYQVQLCHRINTCLTEEQTSHSFCLGGTNLTS